MAAAVNPCGFALLPGYFGYHLWDHRDVQGWPLARRAVTVSVTVAPISGQSGDTSAPRTPG
jgi:hypothetical protein